MRRGITLFKQPQERVYIPNRGEGFRLRVEALSADGMPAEIFLHQQTLVDRLTGQQAEEFVCICSCFDLTIYPVDAPNLSQFPQFYRKSVFDVILASQTMADETWKVVQQEVTVLVKSLNKLDVLSAGNVIRIGDPETADESISESIEIAEELAAESLSESYNWAEFE